MTSTSISPVRHGEMAERDGLLAPALYVSIAIAIFAVVTQLLAATGATSLSTTQQLTMWLVAAGLIVLLWIAYMTCRAYVTARAEKAEVEQARTAALEANERRDEALAAKAVAEQEARAAGEQLAHTRQDAEQQKARAEKAEAEAGQARTAALEANERRDEALAAKAVAEQEARAAWKQFAQAAQDAGQKEKGETGTCTMTIPPGAEQHENSTDGSGQLSPGRSEDGSAGEDGDAWLPPDKLKHLDGSERSVSTAEVFPDGCYLETDSIGPAADKLTGQQVYQCRVLDLNPALKDRPHETVVNILADQTPPPTSMPRFGLVEFDGLTITPYVTDQSPMRIRYLLRATGISPAAATAGERVQAIWTTPGSSEAATAGKAGAHGTSVAAQMLKAAGTHVAKELARDVVANVLNS